MMTKLYFVKTNGYDMLVADNGTGRKVLVDCDDVKLYLQEENALEYLKNIWDTDTWDDNEGSALEIIGDNEIMAEYTLPELL